MHWADFVGHLTPAPAVGDIELHEAGQRAALLREPRGGVRAVRSVAVSQHELDTGGGEGARDAEADTGYPAGDESRFAGEVHGSFPRVAI